MCFSTIVDLLYAIVLHLKYVVLCVFKWRCFTLCVVQHLNGIDLCIFKWRQLTKGSLLNGFWHWITHGVCQRFKRRPKTSWWTFGNYQTFFCWTKNYIARYVLFDPYALYQQSPRENISKKKNEIHEKMKYFYELLIFFYLIC